MANVTLGQVDELTVVVHNAGALLRASQETTNQRDEHSLIELALAAIEAAEKIMNAINNLAE